MLIVILCFKNIQCVIMTIWVWVLYISLLTSALIIGRLAYKLCFDWAYEVKNNINKGRVSGKLGF